MTLDELKGMLVDNGYEDVVVFDSPDYADAFIGVTYNNHAVYDYDKMVEWLVAHENMTPDDAADFIGYNSSFSCGDYPMILFSKDSMI